MQFINKNVAIRNLLIYCVGYLFLFPMIINQLMILFKFNVLLQNIIVVSFYGVTFFLILLPSLSYLKEEWKKINGNWRFFIKQIGIHQLLMYGLNFCANLLIVILSGSEISNNQSEVLEMINSNLLGGVLLAVIFAPLIEELVFRSSVFSLFYKKNKTLAILIASSAFGLIHVLTSIFSHDWTDCLYFISYASMGYCLCRCYIKTNNGFGPIFLHMLNNSLSMLLLLLF